MRPLERTLFASGGLLMIALGLIHLGRGMFSFTNTSYHQTMFSAGSIGTGVLLIACAFLPSGKSVYKRISTRRAPLRHRGRHRST